MAQPDTRDPMRKADLAAIHIRKSQLRLPDDDYRDLLFSIARVRSAAELDFAGRRQVLDHLAKLGEHYGVKFERAKRTGMPRREELPSDRAALFGKLNAQLLALGLTRDYLERAAAGRVSMCRRIAGVDALEFATPAGLKKLVVALVKHQARKAA